MSQLQFIGTGSAFAKKNFNSCAVLTNTRTESFTSLAGKPVTETYYDRLLIDCGRTTPEALIAAGLKWHDIDAVYVSHAHSDHAGGLEEFAFSRMFIPPKKKPTLFGEKGMIADLWTHTLSGGLKPGVGRTFDLEDYFNVIPLFEEKVHQWGPLGLSIMRTKHIMDSFGLFVAPYHAGYGSSKKFFFTSDSTFTPTGFEAQFDAADVIFHDCEIGPYQSGVHAHYNELKTLPEKWKRKMWLYHYQDYELPNPFFDSFAGFVKQGQVFEL